MPSYNLSVGDVKALKAKAKAHNKKHYIKLSQRKQALYNELRAKNAMWNNTQFASNPL